MRYFPNLSTNKTKIESDLTALLSVVSRNQIAWIPFRFTIHWFILTKRSPKVSKLFFTHMKTTFCRVEFFKEPRFSGKTSRLILTLSNIKRTFCSTFFDQACVQYLIHCWFSSENWRVTTSAIKRRNQHDLEAKTSKSECENPMLPVCCETKEEKILVRWNSYQNFFTKYLL